MADNSQQFRPTFYWFDYETFGLDKSRDRPAQFGGLRTTTDMKPIGRPHLFYCIPADDYLPSPEACMLTGITPFKCFDEGDAEAVFATKIFNEMYQPGTISIGYNNMAFDDEVTRFMFWRNLIDPYKREWGEGRRRLDLFLIVLALYAFKPNSINWPKKADGTLSFKLEHLSQVNNLKHQHAHDAASDAVATFYLGRLISHKEPKFWQYVLDNTEKHRVHEVLKQQRPLLYVDQYAGAVNHFLRVIFPLQPNPKYPNEWFCWDLAHSPDEFYALTPEDVRKRLFVSKEDREKGVKKIPFVRVKAQTAPFLLFVPGNFDKLFSKVLGVTFADVKKRTTQIRANGIKPLEIVFPELAAIREENYKDSDTKQYLETRLYSEDFLSDQDRAILEMLRLLPPAELSITWNTKVFKNKNLPEMISRYVARNYPEFLTNEQEEIWREFKGDLLVHGRDQARTFNEFFNEINRLRQQPSDNPNLEDLLAELFEYAQGLLDDF